MRRKLNLNFDILSDHGNRIATQFGLTFTLSDELKSLYQKLGADLARFNGDSSWTLPMPTRFVVDRQAIIRSVAVDPDYTKRPEPDDTVKFLRELASLPKAG